MPTFLLELPLVVDAGQVLPRSVGIPRAGARLPQSLATNQQGQVYRHGKLEALG